MFGAILTQSCTMFHLCPFISIFSFPISAILSLTRWLFLSWQVQPAVWVSNWHLCQLLLFAGWFLWFLYFSLGRLKHQRSQFIFNGFVSHEKSWKIRLASWTFGPTDQAPGWLFHVISLDGFHVACEGKNLTTALFIYLSSDVGHMTDHHPWSETYTDWLRLSGHVGWLRLSGHVGYLVKYNSQVSPASEVWRDRWVGGTTRPTLSCPRFFHTDMTLTACSLPNLAGGSVAVSESNKSEWLDHVWKRMYPTTFGHVGLSSGRSRGLEVLPKVRNLQLTYSSFQKASCLLFPSLKKRIINIQSRIAKIKKPKKNPIEYPSPSSTTCHTPPLSAEPVVGWFGEVQPCKASTNRLWMLEWIDTNTQIMEYDGIYEYMHLCMEMYMQIMQCKGFANIWVKGGSLTKMPFILFGTIAALSSSLWPLNSWNTKGLCHFQPQEVSQPSHFFWENEPDGSSSKPLPSYGNVHEFSRNEIDSGSKPFQMTSFQPTRGSHHIWDAQPVPGATLGWHPMKLEGQLGQLPLHHLLHHFWLMLQLGLGPQFLGQQIPFKIWLPLITKTRIVAFGDSIAANSLQSHHGTQPLIWLSPGFHSLPVLWLLWRPVAHHTSCHLLVGQRLWASVPLHHPQHKTQHDPLTTNINPWPAKTAPAPLSAPFLPAAALQGLPAVPPAFGLVALLEAPIVAWHHWTWLNKEFGI